VVVLGAHCDETSHFIKVGQLKNLCYLITTKQLPQFICVDGIYDLLLRGKNINYRSYQEVLQITNPPTFLTLFNSKLSGLQRNCNKLKNSKQSCSAFVPEQPQHFVLSPYLKASSSEIIIQIKLVGMSMIVYSTRLHLSKCRVPEFSP
jgi:hypothetical protein